MVFLMDLSRVSYNFLWVLQVAPDCEISCCKIKLKENKINEQTKSIDYGTINICMYVYNIYLYICIHTARVEYIWNTTND